MFASAFLHSRAAAAETWDKGESPPRAYGILWQPLSVTGLVELGATLN